MANYEQYPVDSGDYYSDPRNPAMRQADYNDFTGKEYGGMTGARNYHDGYGDPNAHDYHPHGENRRQHAGNGPSRGGAYMGAGPSNNARAPQRGYGNGEDRMGEMYPRHQQHGMGQGGQGNGHYGVGSAGRRPHDQRTNGPSAMAPPQSEFNRQGGYTDNAAGSRRPHPAQRGGFRGRGPPPPRRHVTERMPHPESQTASAQDNPFPVFSPGRGRPPHEQPIEKAMAGMSIQDGSRSNARPRPPASAGNQNTPFEQSHPGRGPQGYNRGAPQDTYSPGQPREPMRSKSAHPQQVDRRPRPEGPAFGHVQRAMTMPHQAPGAVEQGVRWDEPGQAVGYYGSDSSNFIRASRPSTANGAETGTRIDASWNHNNSLEDLYDEYLDEATHPSDPSSAYGVSSREAEIEAEMPNFDAQPAAVSQHRRGDILEQHLLLDMPELEGSVQQHLDHRPAPGSGGTSQPDFSRHGGTPVQQGAGGYGAVSGTMAGNNGFDQTQWADNRQYPPEPGYGPNYNRAHHPNAPPQSYRSQHPDRIPNQSPSSGPDNFPTGYQYPNPARQPQGYPPPGTRLNGDGGPMAPQTRALPRHAVPVRPGLMEGPSQPSKPPPVRQYTSDASPASGSIQSPPSSTRTLSQRRRSETPVTREELDRLRAKVKANSRDHETALRLAKRLVEASTVLVDEGGRADQKTRAKNRENYIFEAHKIVKKLVSANYPEAQFYLADCYGQGLLGLEVDTKEAFNLYQSAAKLGHGPSAYRTAVCCEMGAEDGGGTRKDPVKAVQWYKRAAALGDAAAMYKMGMILLKGLLGQAPNLGEAINWLKRAAERADEENPHALHELALLYLDPPNAERIIRDEAYAFSLFKQAAELGYKFSQFRLGQSFEYGLMGCPIDARNSIAWYSRAAAQEEHQAELALSGWYLTGAQGILEQSDTEAYLWARKAACADPPLPKAMFAMGYFCEIGIGCPRSLEEAKRWYGRAAAYKFPKAQERLEELRKGGVKAQKSRERLSRSNQKQHEAECTVM